MTMKINTALLLALSAATASSAALAQSEGAKVGLEEILVVEDKRPVIESQVKEILFKWRMSI